MDIIKQKDPAKEFEILKQIGSGTYGEVYKVGGGVGGGRLTMRFTEWREGSKAALQTVSSQCFRHYNVLIVSFSVVTMITWYCCISV